VGLVKQYKGSNRRFLEGWGGGGVGTYNIL